MNNTALKDKISESCRTNNYYANKLGVSVRTFYNKVNGLNDFTTAEAIALKEALGLTQEEAFDIFLS